MTMTEQSYTAETKIRPLTREEIGKLVKTLRTYKQWTQDTLAELSGLETRTVQRVEQGSASSLDTRRAIARAFTFEDVDYFDRPMCFPSDEELKEQQAAFERDHLMLDACMVDGRQLLTSMQQGPGFHALCGTSLVELPHGAQDTFAAITDFVRDCINVFDECSSSDLLEYGDTIDGHIRELKKAGFCLCAAFRDTKVTNDRWADKTPMQFRITYLAAAPKDRPARIIVVPRKLSFSF